MKEYYKKCFIYIYEILNNYRDILFCLGIINKNIERKRLHEPKYLF